MTPPLAKSSYDFIICGTGASGLLTAYRMSKDKFFSNKSILLIDKESKNSDDRTWCYWEKGTGEWDHLLTKTWPNIYFGSPMFSDTISLQDYQYKMLRSSAFYKYLWSEINQHPGFHCIVENIIAMEETAEGAEVRTTQSTFKAKKVINSIFDAQILNTQKKYPYLKQHFIGWFIYTTHPAFQADTATFMDFNIPQQGNTRFMYVLPTDAHHALIEYTLFSETLLDPQEYETAIRDYLEKLGIKDYVIKDKEYGNIPMTSYRFDQKNTSAIIHIGSAGGWTKASTGYTFAASVKKSKELVRFIKTGKDFRLFQQRNRFWYFDMIFLGVLHHDNHLGSQIFSSIFKNNDINRIFRFLDEDAGWLDTLRIIFRTQPKLQFLSSFFRNLPKILWP